MTLKQFCRMTGIRPKEVAVASGYTYGYLTHSLDEDIANLPRVQAVCRDMLLCKVEDLSAMLCERALTDGIDLCLETYRSLGGTLCSYIRLLAGRPIGHIIWPADISIPLGEMLYALTLTEASKEEA